MELPIDKIKGFSAAAILNFLCAVTPGILFIYVFNKHLFFSIDIFRLVILSIAITIPVIGYHSFLFFYFIESSNNYYVEKKNKKATIDKNVEEESMEDITVNVHFHNRMTFSVYAGSIITCLLFSLITIVDGYLHASPLKQELNLLIFFEVIIFLIVGGFSTFFQIKINKLKKQKQKK